MERVEEQATEMVRNGMLALISLGTSDRRTALLRGDRCAERRGGPPMAAEAKHVVWKSEDVAEVGSGSVERAVHLQVGEVVRTCHLVVELHTAARV